MSLGKVLALSALTVALFSSSSGAPAQIGVSIGVAPVCPYGYFDYAPYDCAPYGNMAPIGSLVGSLSEPDRGFTDIRVFTVMSTTATILITGTMDHCRNMVQRRSTTSAETRPGMGAAT